MVARYRIAGMFGGNNFWRIDLIKLSFGEKSLVNWCNIHLLYNVHVMFGWF